MISAVQWWLDHKNILRNFFLVRQKSFQVQVHFLDYYQRHPEPEHQSFCLYYQSVYNCLLAPSCPYTDIIPLDFTELTANTLASRDHALSWVLFTPSSFFPSNKFSYHLSGRRRLSKPQFPSKTAHYCWVWHKTVRLLWNKLTVNAD